MNHSDDIGALATALCLAQSKITPPTKEHRVDTGKYRYTYADLASVLEAVRGPLTSSGLSWSQPYETDGKSVTVETWLLHGESGQWMQSVNTHPVDKPGIQGIGSAVTYARRYSLMSVLGIAPEDDDGAAAMPAHSDAVQRALKQPPKPVPPPAKKPPMSHEERLKWIRGKQFAALWELDDILHKAESACSEGRMSGEELDEVRQQLTEKRKELTNESDAENRGDRSDAGSNGAEAAGPSTDAAAADQPS